MAVGVPFQVPPFIMQASRTFQLWELVAIHHEVSPWGGDGGYAPVAAWFVYQLGRVIALQGSFLKGREADFIAIIASRQAAKEKSEQKDGLE